MLSIPPIGFSTSTNVHNCSMVIACDWVEANIIFAEEKITPSDLVDVLCDNDIYTDQDFAAEFVSDLWSNLAQRRKWLNECSPFELDEKHIKRLHNWDIVPAHSLCIFLALATYYKQWAKDAGAGAEYVKQGYLFEKVTKEALEKYGWDVLHTGWSSGIQNAAFNKIVQDTATHLNEPYVNNPIVGLFNRAKEEGLDLVCHKPFIDGKGGKPSYLVQCASGANWTDKLKEPDISGVWNRLITFSTNPLRACALPFVIDDDKFFTTCLRVEGMVLDRYRILSAGNDNINWISKNLKKEIKNWLKPKIKNLLESLNESSI